ncbi:DNA polymerase-3 subunit beta [Paenibacillus sp. LBL]|uniref:DNA polymerase III subunit beta n=1 Tax=Paenibacillus sp. LBL TaxID=2940563 RepID=UPI0024758DBB|nr:DNA polymerase III subunit beta [Paenibacillus sp. LBL]MDH6674972.1 DNA polymerase-3 subunit beta [Paenibacillus sp. LBL]
MATLLERQHGLEEDLDMAVSQDVVSFNVEHDALMNALTLCAKVVPRSGSIPILQCIKFDLQEDTLFITAMDMGQSVLQMLKVENAGNTNGSYLFPAKEGIDLVKRLPHGNLTFIKKESTVHITYGERGKAKLKVLSSEEYPALPQGEAPQVISVPIDVLRKGALAARFSLVDEKLPSLTGIHIYDHGGKLGFEATDRHRIYRYVSDVSIVNQDPMVDAVIPALNFKLIVDSLKDAQNVDLIVMSSHLVLRDKNIIYFGRLIETNFPELTKIFEGMNQGEPVTLSRAELDDTLNRALSLDATNNRVTLEVNPDGVFILHTQSENSELTEEFTNVQAGNEFPVMKFNGRYLRDALLVGDREVKNVTLRVNGAQRPGFVTLDGDPSITMVINPVT